MGSETVTEAVGTGLGQTDWVNREAETDAETVALIAPTAKQS